MLQPPSLQGDFPLVYSADPALSLPEDPVERATALRVARETGNWRPILLAGQEPTVFACAPLHGSALTWLRGEASRGEWSQEELFEYAFRLSIRRVDNLGALQIGHELTARGHKIQTLASLDELYDIGRQVNPLLGRLIVQELGAVIVARAAETLPPKS
jgi:hypothetical protein